MHSLKKFANAFMRISKLIFLNIKKFYTPVRET